MITKKIMHFLIGLSAIFLFSSSIADPLSLTAYQQCSNLKFNVNYRLRNNYVFVATTKGQFFLPTDQNGIFTLDEEQQGKVIEVYLANEENTIFPGCRSEITATKYGNVFLHGLCPSSNCVIIK